MTLTAVYYTAAATAEGGREGRTTSADGQLDLVVSPPRELGGPGSGTNPEQLFAAGFASCFHSALKLVARRAKHDVEASTVTAEVGIGHLAESRGFGCRCT
jgi:osmotically inducible protein OsmC